MKKANITWLTDDLATGGDLSYDAVEAWEQVDDIVAQGITDILDMRIEANDHHIWGTEPGITYLWMPTNDVAGHTIPERLFHDAVKHARKVQARRGRLLAHCHMGINRGPSVAYAILLDRGMDPVDAFELIRSKREEAAIAYAKDALAAHHTLRLLEGRFGFDARDERERLASHINSVWTPQELLRIRRIIRENNDRDSIAMGIKPATK